VDGFYESLTVRAASIEELLSDAFEALPGQKADADLAARRLAAWCRACASGDWSLFERRLARDGLSIAEVLARFASVRRSRSAAKPARIEDAIWIETAFQRPGVDMTPAVPGEGQPRAFEHLFAGVIAEAEQLLWAALDEDRACRNLSEPARACPREALLKELSNLCAPALYERFAERRKGSDVPLNSEGHGGRNTSQYERFIADMKAGGMRRLFADKPVLLRLLAGVTRQWIEATRELISRLDADLSAIRCDLLPSGTPCRVNRIEGDLSDPHNGGRSVQIVSFEDGARVVYKPKDLRLDARWCDLIERLNASGAPIELKPMRVIARDGYGWAGFVEHAPCPDQKAVRQFFMRAGAWLALFHCFAATDMHQENIIAAGDHPVPIDLEMILQPSANEQKPQGPEHEAYTLALETIANSVSMVGLLPSYGRSPDAGIFAIGGLVPDQNARTERSWSNINSDAMRLARTMQVAPSASNLPHVAGAYASFGDHIEDFIAGFAAYATFLQQQRARLEQLLDGFAGLPVRKIIRPTRFYYMLLQRLKDHRTMEDGAIWSAQMDFIARLADWDQDRELAWPLQRAERAALAQLNVPYFILPSDGREIGDAAGASIRTDATPGIDRARARIQSLDEDDISWQIEVIRQNTQAVSSPAGVTGSRPLRQLHGNSSDVAAREVLIAEADTVAAELASRAIRRGPGAAWIGVDWLGDSEVSQLIALGPDLYNGTAGIAVFLAAHAGVRQCDASRELALAAVAHLRKSLRGRNRARMARALGTGGAAGVGSIVYALAVMAQCLADRDLLADARAAAALFTPDLISADKQLDVAGGNAGGILGLLRLFADTGCNDALDRAVKCGEHLIAQPRRGVVGRRSWSGPRAGSQPLNGMPHGAAGFAYALGSLAGATGREEFAQAAAECIAFENASYDGERNNWPDLRDRAHPAWPSQWCHGAAGIGLARIGMRRRGARNDKALEGDIQNALADSERGWPNAVDSLCCGTLGNVEFLYEAARALGRDELAETASRRLSAVLQTAAAAGDYRWNSGIRRFNLGLFRGLAGVGYTLLRRLDPSLPNVLIWE
jgi:type 2 lantibiotic biosynthesis protein LanM